MKGFASFFALTIALFLGACTSTPPSPALSQAELFIGNYQSLERSFDPDLAELYCNNALIRYTHTGLDRKNHTMEIPAAEYKKLMRTVMPKVQSRGEYNIYSDMSYAPEGGNIRVTALAHSVLDKYVSRPISLLLGVCDNGKFGILEDLR